MLYVPFLILSVPEHSITMFTYIFWFAYIYDLSLYDSSRYSIYLGLNETIPCLVYRYEGDISRDMLYMLFCFIILALSSLLCCLFLFLSAIKFALFCLSHFVSGCFSIGVNYANFLSVRAILTV